MTTNTSFPFHLALSSLVLSCATLLGVAGCDTEDDDDTLERDGIPVLDEDDDEIDNTSEPGSAIETHTGADQILDGDSGEAIPIKLGEHVVEEPDGSLVVKGDSCLVRVHAKRRVAELRVKPAQLADWYARPYERWAPEATKALYEVFADDFDFIVFVPAQLDQHPMLADGRSTKVKNDIAGLGLPQFDKTAFFGSKGRLQHTVLLGGIEHVVTGPSLRELGNNWANYALPSVTWGAFGYADVGGQLGGCSPGSMEQLGADLWTCEYEGTLKWSPDGAATNDRPYGDFELYLMGLLDPNELLPITYFADGEWVDENQRTFTGLPQTVSLLDIVGTHGKRLPDHGEAQTKFTTLFVALSSADEPLSATEFSKLDDRVGTFTAPQPMLDWPGMLNFAEATAMRATLSSGGLDASLL